MRRDLEACIVAAMIHIRCFGMAVLLTLAATGGVSAQGPSFDCARATEPVEKAICDDPVLARLDLDVARAYDEVRGALDPTAATLLKGDQKLFLSIREGVHEHDSEGLAARLRERQAFLARIRASPPDAFAGEWRNALGVVRVTRKDGTLDVSISSVEPIAARWVCNVEGTARRDGDALVIDSDADEDRWSVRVSRSGATLDVEQLEPHDGSHPLCGMNGTFAGAYFAVSPD